MVARSVSLYSLSSSISFLSRRFSSSRPSTGGLPALSSIGRLRPHLLRFLQQVFYVLRSALLLSKTNFATLKGETETTALRTRVLCSLCPAAVSGQVCADLLLQSTSHAEILAVETICCWYHRSPAMQRKRNNEKDKVEVKKVKERHMSLSIFMSAETVLNIRVDFLLLTFLPSSRQHCRCMRYWSVKICRQLSSAKAYEAHTTTSCKRYQPYKCWMKRKPQRTTKRPTRRCLVLWNDNKHTFFSPRFRQHSVRSNPKSSYSLRRLDTITRFLTV